MAKPTFGAFNQGDMPRIAVFNKAITPLGVDLDGLIAAMQVYIDKYIVPVWATPAKLVKMLVDPGINLMTTGPDPKTVYAYESADPVESLTFPVNNIPMSDFVYPSYFEDFHKAGSVKFDQMGKVRKPFDVLSGGYQIIFKGGKWSQVYGSVNKERAFKNEDRRGHRSEARKLAKLKRAEPSKIKKAEVQIKQRVEQAAAQTSTVKSKVLAGVAGRRRTRG